MVKDHLGNEFKNTTEMCKHYNIEISTFSKRISRGDTLEQALRSVNKSEECYDHLGNRFKSLSLMCKHYNITEKAYLNRLKKGWDIESVLTVPMREGVTDHLGNKFETISDMCKYYGITRDTYASRLALGWDLERILTEPLAIMKKACTDHLGNKYNSIYDICRHYGINSTMFNDRLSRGWTLEQTLTTPARTTNTQHRKKECSDHLGNKFESVNKLCNHYNIAYGVFYSRIKRGWSLEKALTEPINQKCVEEVCYDHLGNEFKSIGVMCEYYEIDKTTFIKRMKAGWELDKALTVPVNTLRGKKCFDHLGNIYKSVSEMCKHYGLSVYVYEFRIRNGWSLEATLTTPVKEHSQKCKDHLGNEFKSIADMARAYNKDPTLVVHRIKSGWTIEEALTA